MMRNGYAEVHTQEGTQVSQEKYTGLDQVEVAYTLAGQAQTRSWTYSKQREYPVDMLGPIPQVNQLPMGAPAPQLIQQPNVYSTSRLRRTKKVKNTKVTPLPPQEEMRVTPRARSGMEGIALGYAPGHPGALRT